MAITFNNDSRFLFVGDSVTESGRQQDPEGLGNGYVRIIRDYLLAKHPPTAPKVLNRATSGLRLSDLASRWPQEVIAERPDVLSILIGINDVAVGPANPTAGASLEQFRTIYRHLLVETAEYLPRCKLVLCEPAALWSTAAGEADENLRPYMHSLMEMAREFDAECVVPLHSAFVYVRKMRPDVPWIQESGHPTSAGQMLIAYTWLEETGLVRRAFT